MSQPGVARSRQPRTDRPSHIRPVIVDPRSAFSGLLLAILLVFLGLVWLIHLESTLPEIRNPRADDTSALLPGHEVAAPGEHSVASLDLQLSGPWIRQELAGEVWHSAVEPGSRLRLAFYGTELYLVGRLGPEAGIAYVRIDGVAPGHLPHGEHGAVADLRAFRAADRAVLIISDLAHGEHLVEITSGDAGEVALSGFIITAQTPFPWVFVLAYAGLLATMVILVRALIFQITTGPDTGLPARRRPYQREPDR